MNNSNIRHYWNGRCTLLLLAVAAVPILSLAWLSTDQPNRLAAAASLDGLVRGPSAVVATVCLYVAWRLSGQRQLAWLAASTATLAVQAVIMAGLQLATIDRAFNENLWMVPFDFLTMLVIGWLVTSAGQRSLLGDPVLIGLGAGLILGLGRLASIVLLPDLDPVWVSRPTAVLGFLAVVVPTVLLLWLLPDVPRWASSRLGAALFLYALAHLSAFLAGHPATVTGSLITLSSDLRPARARGRSRARCCPGRCRPPRRSATARRRRRRAPGRPARRDEWKPSRTPRRRRLRRPAPSAHPRPQSSRSAGGRGRGEGFLPILG